MPDAVYPSKDAIPYEFMDKEYYCGPACAEMMILHLLHLDVTQSSFSQSDLIKLGGKYTYAGDEAPWSSYITDPNELVDMLNLSLTSGGFEFVAKKQVTGPTITEKKQNFRMNIKSLLDSSSECPVIIPAHSWAHWVLLYKYGKYQGESFNSFIGHDPFYLGTGSTSKTPPVVIHIADKDENFYYKKKNNVFEANTLVAIKPIMSPFNLRTKNTSTSPTPQPIGGTPINIIPPTASHIIKTLRDYGLMNSRLTRHVLSTKTPSYPLYVKWLDYPDRDYFLIALQGTPLRVPQLPLSQPSNYLLTRLSSNTKEFLDAIEIPPTEYLLGKSSLGSPLIDSIFLSPQVPADKRIPWSEAFKQELAKTDLNGRPIPDLVWKPCIPSPSAFYPFYRVTSHTDNTTFYVRIDGKLFRDLPLTLPLP